MWEIYDALIDGIPEDLTADQIICGSFNTIVTTRLGAGISIVLDDATRLPVAAGNLLEKPLREIAELVKSWNLPEASVGHAAINSYYNSPEIARKNGVAFSDRMFIEDRLNDPFISSQNDVRGKNVAVVGHFPYLETFFEPVCELSIIEWEPEEYGDYPLAASEFILPKCDFVYISCRSIVDKSLPRLLRLSENARHVAIVGPATTLAPSLLSAGVSDLSGFIIKDVPKAQRYVSGAENATIYQCGQKVSFKQPAAQAD